MDTAFLAVAGIALLVTGVIGFAAVTLVLAAAALRHSLLPMLRPLAARLADEARGWLAPPEAPARPSLARVPTRTSPNR